MAYFPDNIITATKETVIAVFWRKKDVCSLFDRCGVPTDLMTRQNWDDYKINIVTPIIDQLNASASGVGPLRRVLSD